VLTVWVKKKSPFLQVKGVKGSSVFCLHPPFDLSKGFAIDSLHVLFLGITRDLLSYWFDKAHDTEDYSIRGKVTVAC